MGCLMLHQWIEACIDSPSLIATLIVSSYGHSKVKEALGRGSLSSYLYVITANIFITLNNHNININKITHYTIYGKCKILHIIYVDDILPLGSTKNPT